MSRSRNLRAGDCIPTSQLQKPMFSHLHSWLGPSAKHFSPQGNGYSGHQHGADSKGHRKKEEKGWSKCMCPAHLFLSALPPGVTGRSPSPSAEPSGAHGDAPSLISFGVNPSTLSWQDILPRAPREHREGRPKTQKNVSNPIKVQIMIPSAKIQEQVHPPNPQDIPNRRTLT